MLRYAPYRPRQEQGLLQMVPMKEEYSRQQPTSSMLGLENLRALRISDSKPPTNTFEQGLRIITDTDNLPYEGRGQPGFIPCWRQEWLDYLDRLEQGEETFDPNDPLIRLCPTGIRNFRKGKSKEAIEIDRILKSVCVRSAYIRRYVRCIAKENPILHARRNNLSIVEYDLPVSILVDTGCEMTTISNEFFNKLKQGVKGICLKPNDRGDQFLTSTNRLGRIRGQTKIRIWMSPDIYYDITASIAYGVNDDVSLGMDFLGSKYVVGITSSNLICSKENNLGLEIEVPLDIKTRKPIICYSDRWKELTRNHSAYQKRSKFTAATVLEKLYPERKLEAPFHDPKKSGELSFYYESESDIDRFAQD